jgi:hypothetical protein
MLYKSVEESISLDWLVSWILDYIGDFVTKIVLEKGDCFEAG